MQRQAHPPRPTPAGQAAATAAEGSSRGGAAADSADTSSAGPVGQQQQQQRAALSVGNGLAIRGASGAQFDTLQQQQQQRQSRNRGGGGRGRGTANGDVAPGGSSSGLGFHRLHPTSSPGFAHQQGGAAAAGPSPRLPANGPRAPLHNAGRYDPSGGGGGGSRLQQQQRIHHQHWASPPGQANIPRPGSSFRPPSHPAGPPQQATASTSISGPWPHGRGHPGPSSSAAHAHVRPMSAKAKKADPFAHLPVYDYQTFPSSRAGRPTLLVVSDPALVDELVGHLGSPVGLDIEWAPTFQAGAPVKPTSLLQISDGQTIVVVQLLALLGRCPPGLRAFLEDENIVKLGVGILPDGTKLSRDLGVECRGFYDLNGLRPPDPQSPKMAKGLAALTGMYTSHRLHKSKNVTMSNWALAKLSPSQIACASPLFCRECPGRRSRAEADRLPSFPGQTRPTTSNRPSTSTPLSAPKPKRRTLRLGAHPAGRGPPPARSLRSASGSQTTSSGAWRLRRAQRTIRARVSTRRASNGQKCRRRPRSRIQTVRP